MDYKKHYELLIKRAKERTLNGYKEKHHIVPRCVGGSDDEENLVYLTPREHYVAHQLLVHIYPNKGKLIYAANMMTVDAHGQRSTNRKYAWLKEKWIEQLRKDASGRKMSEAEKKRRSEKYSGEGNPMYGKKGADHPSFGIKPWRSHTSMKSNEDWKYSLVIYDYFIQDQKYNPFNKKTGHKRIVKDLGLESCKIIRGIIEKISMAGWNPYTEPDLLEWAKEKGHEMPKMDLSKFRFPLAFKYACDLYDWNSTKQFRRGSKFTQLYKERPDLHNIDNIPNSHIIYILETLIQEKGWNPYTDIEYKNWMQKWHS
ncbi:homing endonuclease [Tegunavirus sp. BRC001]